MSIRKTRIRPRKKIDKIHIYFEKQMSHPIPDWKPNIVSIYYKTLEKGLGYLKLGENGDNSDGKIV